MSSAAPDAPLDQAAILAALRARMARLEGSGRALHKAGPVPVCEGLPLPGGGLASAALHEVLATAPGCGVWRRLLRPAAGPHRRHRPLDRQRQG